jgi:hypothetical protein
VKAKPAIADDPCDLIDSDLAGVGNLQRTPRDEPAVLDRKDNGFEKIPVLIVK